MDGYLERKVVSGIMFTLLLMGMLILTFNVQPVKSAWTGTVYIRADGSIDPADAPIITYDNVTYTLTDNITSSADGIVVERNNIVIDCAGYTLQGTGAYESKGIILRRINNVTIKNVIINNFQDGIRLYDSLNNTILENNITNNGYGILLWESLNNTISGNNITANTYSGIWLTSSSDNGIDGNNIANNGDGIALTSSSNNRITGNTFFHNGLYVSNSYGNVVIENWVNGKPLVYLEDTSDLTVEDAGQVILINCIKITVENLNLSNISVGIRLLKTKNSTITRNNITNSRYGIWLESSSPH